MSDANVFEGLRSQALATQPGDIGIAVGPHDAFGAVMDWPIGGATATVVAFATGDASIYLSNGGGFIGGGQHAAVSDAGKGFVAAANQMLDMMTPAGTTPLPAAGMAIFYVLTGNGIVTASGPVEDLGMRRSPLSPLFHAAQAIVTAYRQMKS